ncbi:MAG: hypothetical protein II975_09970 [Bacteroidales bacterium]|nr:hypothetical protein [Bacteroidales bacterium]
MAVFLFLNPQANAPLSAEPAAHHGGIEIKNIVILHVVPPPTPSIGNPTRIYIII